MRGVLGIAVILCAMCAICTLGDTQITHTCVAPERPADENDDTTWNAFMPVVDEYRECISTFVEDNHAASDVHRTAANEATKEWNAFVHRELNVPGDFPWPPENPQDRRP